MWSFRNTPQQPAGDATTDASTPASVGVPVLEAGGFSARVDAYAGESDPDPAARLFRLWFVSLLGSQQSVKALWARLIKGDTVTLTGDHLSPTRFCALAPQDPRGWRFFTASLPTAAGFQGVLVPNTAFFSDDRAEFLLLPRPDDDPAALHYRFLNRRLDLPLHPSWAAWLWQRARTVGEASALESTMLAAYRCRPNAAALAADLSVAVRQGLLGVAAAEEAPGATRA